MTKVQRRLIVASQTGTIRTGQFDSREHLIVPVVMLVEGVMWANNSPRPEMVYASEFSKAPKGWDGRPVVGGHPTMHGSAISANDPMTLESEKFGQLFHTTVKDNRLISEAWIDPIKAAKPGSIGERVLARIRAGEEILEVSVGAFITSEDAVGVFDGRKFEGVWREIVPDHLAILAEGDIGACSVNDGCGAMRSATVHLFTAQGVQPLYHRLSEVEVKIDTSAISKEVADALPEFVSVINVRDKPMDEEIKPRSLKERLVGLWNGLRAAALEDVTDGDVHRAIDKALLASEPAFMGIETVSQQGNWVVFAAMPDGAFHLFRRTFSVEDDGTVTLKDDREEVQQAPPSFEPVAAVSAETPKTACGCGGGQIKENTTPVEGENEMDKKQKIAALIASKKLGAVFTEAVLETMSDAQLDAIEKSANEVKLEEPKVEAQPEPKAESVVSAAAPTFEQLLASAPQDVRESMNEGMRIAAERRAAVIKVLKDTGRCDFTDEEFKSMTIPALERLVKLASVTPAAVDFSGRGVVRAAEDSGVPAPPKLTFAKKA